ncbi:MAG: NUDIX domain-containing protein, partial [Novosphingobium sp.]
GVRVVVIDAAERVLLIRHSYGSAHWMLPGGGIKRDEDARAAAAREVFEEAGLVIEDAVEIGRVTEIIHGSNNDVRVVVGWTEGMPRADLREITDAEFFAPGALPHGISSRLPALLPGYVKAAEAARRLR